MPCRVAGIGCSQSISFTSLLLKNPSATASAAMLCSRKTDYNGRHGVAKWDWNSAARLLQRVPWKHHVHMRRLQSPEPEASDRQQSYMNMFIYDCYHSLANIWYAVQPWTLILWRSDASTLESTHVLPEYFFKYICWNCIDILTQKQDISESIDMATGNGYLPSIICWIAGLTTGFTTSRGKKHGNTV